MPYGSGCSFVVAVSLVEAAISTICWHAAGIGASRRLTTTTNLGEARADAGRAGHRGPTSGLSGG